MHDGNIASCSEDKNIYIWNSFPPYEKKCSLIGHISEVTSIIQLKDGKIISTSSKNNEGILKIWILELIKSKEEQSYYNIINQETMSKVFCHCINSLAELDNGKVAVGGYKLIRIVDINAKQIILNIECHNSLISALVVMNDK